MNLHLTLKSLPVLLFALLTLSACREDPVCPLQVGVGEPFTLRKGECATVDRTLRVVFDSVLEDSRCPVDVECVWEGNAKVGLSWSVAGSKPQPFALNTHTGFTTDTVIMGYTVRLDELNPRLRSDQRYDTIDYRARLVVTK